MSAVSQVEQDQILQTIEMFEVITQSNPRDQQSLEILKDAYGKLGREKEAGSIARRLAEVYYDQGQYSLALLEYENILKIEPDSPEIVARLGEVEAKLQESGPTEEQKKAEEGSGISLDFSTVVRNDPTLITTPATRRPEAQATPEMTKALADDGNDSMAKFLIQHRIAPENVVNAALDHVRRVNRNLSGEALADSLIDEIVKSRVVDLETLLGGILDRTKFAYIPLEYYDVDRQIVKMLPESLTLGRLIVPFDIMSRTIMIAMANPFDAPGKEAVQQLLDYNIQWHLAAPSALAQVLREAYRLDSRD